MDHYLASESWLAVLFSFLPFKRKRALGARRAVGDRLDGMPLMPDGRSHTIWDTIRTTIEELDIALYLVLDEAHRGMRDAVEGHADHRDARHSRKLVML